MFLSGSHSFESVWMTGPGALLVQHPQTAHFTWAGLSIKRPGERGTDYLKRRLKILTTGSVCLIKKDTLVTQVAGTDSVGGLT